MAKPTDVNFTNPKTKKSKKQKADVTVQPDGSVTIIAKLETDGRIVPGTDVVIDFTHNGKKVTGTATPQLLADGTVEMRLPAGSAL